MGKLLKLFIVVIVFWGLVSCGKKHKNNQNDNITKRENLNVNSKTNTENLLLANKIANEQDTFSLVEMKLNLKLNSSQQNLSLSGNMRIAYDSIIWMNFSMMGIEGARAKLTPDSVFFIVPIKKLYFKGSYSYLKNIFPLDVDFYTVQNLFLDRFFIFPKNDFSLLEKYFNADKQNDILKIVSDENYEKNFLVTQDVSINTQNNKVLTNLLSMPSQKRSLEIYYSSFTESSSHVLPFNIEFKTGDAVISIVYSKVVYGKKTTYPFKIPANYTPISTK